MHGYFTINLKSIDDRAPPWHLKYLQTNEITKVKMWNMLYFMFFSSSENRPVLSFKLFLENMLKSCKCLHKRKNCNASSVSEGVRWVWFHCLREKASPLYGNMKMKISFLFCFILTFAIKKKNIHRSFQNNS